jgi:hypothetical protein
MQVRRLDGVFLAEESSLRGFFVRITAVVGGAAQKGSNGLMIVVDDHNDWIGCLKGQPSALTPHTDRLAARGTLFANAHTPAPLCNPSRASVMSGLRPRLLGSALPFSAPPSPR